MIVKTIDVESIQLSDHTLSEIFVDADYESQAALLARTAKTVLAWQGLPGVCEEIAAQLKKIKCTRK